MLKEEKRQLKEYKKMYKKNKEFDGSKGQCCCKFENVEAVRTIMIIDIIFFFLLWRSILAFLALTDRKKIAQYSKVRKYSFYVQSLILLLGFLASILIQVLLNLSPNYVLTVVELLGVILLVVCDFHFTSVVEYFVKYNLDTFL